MVDGFGARIARALGGGMAVGAALAALEGVWLRLELAVGGERVALLLGVLALLVVGGGLGGLLLGLGDEVARRWFGRQAITMRALMVALMTGPWWGTVGWALGGSRKLGRWFPWLAGWPAGVLGMTVMGGVVLLGARAALGWLPSVKGEPRAVRRGMLAGGLAAGAVGAFWLDATLWRRLYPEFHAGLLGGACAGLLGTLAVLWQQAPEGGRQGDWNRSLRGLGLGLGLLAPVAVLGLRWTENVWFLAQDQTTATRQVLAVVMRAVDWNRGPPPQQVGQRRRPQRRPGTEEGGDGQGQDAGRKAPLGAAAGGRELPAAPAAHLVLITVDALRPDHLGSYGYQRRVAGQPLTPSMDGLAARGVRFERVYAQAPHTAYSIASLLASEYVHSTVRLGLPPPMTLAELLGRGGWRTEAYFPGGLFFNGRRELGSYAERHFGFGRAVTEDLDARKLTDQAIARIEEIHREGEPRTFLWLHYFDAHEPYVTQPGFELGDTPLDRYDSEVAYLDREIGRLLGALARLDRPVVLALTADHGEEFKEHGGWYHGSSLYEEQVRVPLLIVAPGLLPRVVRGTVELVDVAPTLLGLLGQSAPAALRGDDLAPVLVGRGEPRRPVYSEMEGRRMVVAEGAKLVHDVRRNTWELYDLAADPRELVNLYDREPARAAALKRELQSWIEGLSAAADDEVPVALKRVRLGDREAVPDLAALIADARQPEAVRAEAARLAGAVEGYAARDTLRRQLAHPALALRAEAALALGELTDRRALATLVELLDEPRYRLRAAIMLGRLRDGRATPALIEAMGAPDENLRRRAIHYLGFVGDGRALAPLMASMAELRTRYLAGLSLGRIGARVRDPRVLPALLERLDRELYEDNRAHLVCALGFLGDSGGLAAARRAALLQPPVKWATETLVRLGALERGVAFGVDFAPGQAGMGAGITGCRQKPPPPGGESTDEYAARTTCQLAATRGEVRFSLPGPVEAVVFLRLAPRGQPGGTQLVLTVNDEVLARVQLDPGWQELRFVAPKARWRAGENRVGIALGGEGDGEGDGSGTVGGSRIELDHLLVVPR